MMQSTVTMEPIRIPAGLAGALPAPRPGPPVARAAAKSDPRVLRFLRRASFGFSEAELEVASRAGLEAWLEYQLDWQAIDDGGLEATLGRFFPTLSMDYQEIFDYSREQMGPVAATEIVLATVLRQLYSPRQLHEVMVEFWTNHFNVYLLDGAVQYLKTGDDRDHVRPHALGRFRDLLHANARSPAMLIYLDNYSNSAEGPNENYARELLELHTLGVDGGYSEEDVREVARCFTGWTLNPRRPGLFTFNPAAHDYGEKRVLGTVIPPNRGIEDGRQVLDLLAAHPATARFVAGKLVRRFVADEPPKALVEAVAETYRRSDGDIPAMLRTLFLSETFAASTAPKFKRPAEYVASIVRRLAGETSDEFLGQAVGTLQGLGQLPFFAAPPTGYPDVESAWLSTSALLERWNLASGVAFGSGAGADQAPPLVLDMRRLTGGARTPAGIVDALVERVLHEAVSAGDREALIALAAGNRDPGAALPPREADGSARAVLAALLAAPQFQNR